ncbi:ATP-binding cassette domain-containing protein [Candidatus Peribacteria bacterium]|nr:ATP-binding cassette domain-containing protein [Candidatus Peribacteria bacterium]
MIILKGVSKDYGDGRVLDGISLEISPGEFVCITGPSGAGKTTLLSILVGAETATGGSISVDGVDLRSVPAGALQMFRRRVGVVFQDYKLLANRTVAENIAFPLEVCGASDDTILSRVKDLLGQMGLGTRAHALPRELSGGEKARTAIARAIAHKPLILLADEPTQNLDPDQAKEVLQSFREINAEGTTVIIATHDAALVDLLHMRVVQLEHGKIARDSVGGYRKAHTEEKQSKAKAKKVETPTHAHPQSHRKVKVTAIHSEG